MKVETRIFMITALFFIVVGAGYSVWTDVNGGGVEWVGAVALGLSAGLCLLMGGFFWFVSRRIDPRPEDRADAEVAEGAGELGFFSPGSYWPLGIALAATVTGVGLAYFLVWLIITGVVLLVTAVAGLLFEYYIGGRRLIR